jgi:hypothetical protein
VHVQAKATGSVAYPSACHSRCTRLSPLVSQQWPWGLLMHVGVWGCSAPTHSIAERVVAAAGSTHKRQGVPFAALPRAVKLA